MYFYLVTIGVAASFLHSEDRFVGSVLQVGTDDMLVYMDVFDCHAFFHMNVMS